MYRFKINLFPNRSPFFISSCIFLFNQLEPIKKKPSRLEFDPETGIPIKKTSSGVEFNPETGEPVFDKSLNKNRRY